MTVQAVQSWTSPGGRLIHERRQRQEARAHDRCPMCGWRDPDKLVTYPPLQMARLRGLVCATHRLECAALELPPPDEYGSLDQATGHFFAWEPGMVLHGVQTVLAERSLLVGYWVNCLQRLVEHGDQQPRLELVQRRYQGLKEDG